MCCKCRKDNIFVLFHLPQPVMTVIPGWATDSVPGFSNHVWAPDVIQWHGRWWLAYSCSMFGKNGAAMLIQRPISWTADGWPELK